MEHNKFCVSVHFRNCPPSAWQQVGGFLAASPQSPASARHASNLVHCRRWVQTRLPCAAQVAEAVDEVTAQQPQLHTTRGRKVLEIRPKVRLPTL